MHWHTRCIGKLDPFKWTRELLFSHRSKSVCTWHNTEINSRTYLWFYLWLLSIYLLSMTYFGYKYRLLGKCYRGFSILTRIKLLETTLNTYFIQWNWANLNLVNITLPLVLSATVKNNLSISPTPILAILPKALPPGVKLVSTLQSTASRPIMVATS